MTIDPYTDVLYIKVKDGEVETTKEEREGILLDIGRRGQLIGISIIHPQKVAIERKQILNRVSRKFHVPVVKSINPAYLARGFTPLQPVVYA